MYDIFLFLSALSPAVALIVALRLDRYFRHRDSERMYRGFMGIPKKRK